MNGTFPAFLWNVTMKTDQNPPTNATKKSFRRHFSKERFFPLFTKKWTTDHKTKNKRRTKYQYVYWRLQRLVLQKLRFLTISQPNSITQCLTNIKPRMNESSILSLQLLTFPLLTSVVRKSKLLR